MKLLPEQKIEIETYGMPDMLVAGAFLGLVRYVYDTNWERAMYGENTRLVSTEQLAKLFDVVADDYWNDEQWLKQAKTK